MITVSVDDDRFLAGLTAAQRGTGFASIVALTRTAKIVTAALNKSTQGAFDRPVPMTQRAVDWEPATRGLPVITVFLKDYLPKGTPPAKYLRAQIEGGTRRQKRSERSLASAGKMGNRGFWVPGPGMKLNAYGNVPGPMMTRILSAVKASSDPTQNITQRSRKTNLSARRGEHYFVPPAGSKLAPGVWRQYASGRLVPVLFFVPTVTYRKRWDFFGMGARFTRATFPGELGKAIGEGWNRPRPSA